MPGRTDILESLDRAIEASLGPRERVIWVGQPSAGGVFRAGTAIWLFALPWTAFALFWEALALDAAFGGAVAGRFGASVPAWVYPLIGVPFVLVGFAMLAAPFWSAMQTGRTGFVVTNQRVLQLRVGPVVSATSLNAEALKDVEAHSWADGRGTIRVLGRFRFGSDADPSKEDIVMRGVKNPEAAADAVRALIAAGEALRAWPSGRA